MSAPKPAPKFAIRETVRVLLNDRNRTAHRGTVREVIWHFKDERYNYYIVEDGKKISKRYFDDDLEPA